VIAIVVAYSTADEEPDPDTFAGVQITVALFFYGLQWIVSMTNRSAMCRRIRCSGGSIKRH